jgi:hypothetical protein
MISILKTMMTGEDDHDEMIQDDAGIVLFSGYVQDRCLSEKKEHLY